MSGWNLLMVHQLRQILREGGGSNTSRQRVVEAVKEWWELPGNERSRQIGLSAREAAVQACAFAMSFPGEMQEHITDRAKISPTAWKGMKQWAYQQALEGHDIPSKVAAILLRPKGPPSPRGRGKGQTPANFNVDSQLAAIVGALRYETSFKSLGTGKAEAHDPTSPLVIVSEATRQPIDVVAKAWKAHRDIFRGL